ncbi:MAG: FKBP-type peptidyl-prolyl cis-trans isomerase [Cyclobacteriaceae bacterium]|nr:FKBP-type peptidyl-prolyl cis-trans isomerase [Cyclobacteriaceae bacterium]UYN87359.1 MAG: FKBP-type peptidyl-prolyl cis-trans isomerase [Cyclobacteriaceae bacterium]
MLAGCLKESPCTRVVSQSRIDALNQTRLQQDIQTIDSYLEDNSITAIADPSGIRYTIDIEGDGVEPCLEYTITVMYKGKLLSTGAQFDASSSPVSFPLSNLILGWQVILPKIKAGSRITLYLPSGFGYGSAASGAIPANSNLIFEIDLIN